MEGIRNLDLNVNVTVFAPDSRNRGENSAKLFRGRIYNRESEKHVVIELQSEDSTHYWTVGKPILLFLAHDLGLYIFSAAVNRLETRSGHVILYCDNPQQIKYFQRRRSVRVNVTIPANFSTEADRDKVWDGTVTDISVGGLKLEAPFDISPGTVMELVFQLDEAGPVFVDAKVVRSQVKNGRHIHGVEYINPDSYCIDNIARFIMAEQMRQKRLGLIMFKAFILEAALRVQTPTVFSIIRYKNLDVSALQGKRCHGTVLEIGLHALHLECPLKLPIGAVLEFSLELPKLGFTALQGTVTEVTSRTGKFIAVAAYAGEYTKIRDCVLNQLAKDYDVPNIAGESDTGDR